MSATHTPFKAIRLEPAPAQLMRAFKLAAQPYKGHLGGKDRELSYTSSVLLASDNHRLAGAASFSDNGLCMQC
eukprot:4025595-Amphidinium_carterae.1